MLLLEIKPAAVGYVFYTDQHEAIMQFEHYGAVVDDAGDPGVVFMGKILPANDATRAVVHQAVRTGQ
jgi:hypothetical protein